MNEWVSYEKAEFRTICHFRFSGRNNFNGKKLCMNELVMKKLNLERFAISDFPLINSAYF